MGLTVLLLTRRECIIQGCLILEGLLHRLDCLVTCLLDQVHHQLCLQDMECRQEDQDLTQEVLHLVLTGTDLQDPDLCLNNRHRLVPYLLVDRLHHDPHLVYHHQVTCHHPARHLLHI